jgi:hypothetical protein
MPLAIPGWGWTVSAAMLLIFADEIITGEEKT